MRPDSFERGKADHLRTVEKELARAALAGVHHELSDGLAEQFPHRLARHFIGHIEGVDIDHLARVALDLWQGALALQILRLVNGRNHTQSKIA